MKISIARHGHYRREEGRVSTGHITPEGSQKIIDFIVKTLDDLGQTTDINKIVFGIAASPTYWLNNKDYGQRAVDTAKIYKTAITSYLKKYYGLSHEESQSRIIDLDKSISYDLREPNYHAKAKNLIKRFEEIYGGKSDDRFWHALAKITSEEILEFGGSPDVESSIEVAQRVARAFIKVQEWSKRFTEQSGMDTFTFLVTHGETLDSFLYKMGIDAETSYNQGIILELKEDEATIISSNITGKVQVTQPKQEFEDKLNQVERGNCD